MFIVPMQALVVKSRPVKMKSSSGGFLHPMPILLSDLQRVLHRARAALLSRVASAGGFTVPPVPGGAKQQGPFTSAVI